MAAAAIVTVSTINANSTPELSDLMIKNLEVLTQGEVGDKGSGPCFGYTADDNDSDIYAVVLNCRTCTLVTATEGKDPGNCE
jgi:hypothetical protein